MKTTTFLLLLFFSSFTAFSQENTCSLGYYVGGNQGLWQDDTEQQICKGGKLKITAYRMSNVTYQWKKDGIVIPNENNAVFYATEEGAYTAEVQTSSCKYVTPRITLKYTTLFNDYGIEINYAYESIKTDEFTICEKGEFFNADINTYIYLGELDYQWQKDGVDIEGAVSRQLLINKAGVYSVRSRQGECLSHARPIKINIKNEKIITPMRLLTSIYFGALNPADTLHVCENTKTGFSSIFGNALNHRWYKNNTLINQGINNRTLDVSESGIYNYETILPNGCEVLSEKIVVNFGKKLIKPTLDFPDESRGCLSNYLSIYDDYPFNSYLQSTGGGYKMSWYKNGVFKNTGWETYLSPNESALYKLVVDIGACSVEDTFRVDNSKPVKFKLKNNLIKNGKISMCEGNEAALRFPIIPSMPTYKYKLQWYRNGNPIDTDVFSLRVRDSGLYHATFSELNNSCMQYSDTIEVTVIKAPYTYFDRVMLSNCSYWLVTEKKDDVTYAWKKDGKLIAGANKFEFFPKESGNYSFVANRGYCFYESGPRSVELLQKSALTEKTIFCENDSLRLKAPKADSYLWQGPNNFSSTFNSPKLPGLTLKNAGLYTLTASLNGCTYKDSILITVNKSPEILIERANEYCLGKSITMIARVDDGYVNWIDPTGNRYNSSILSVANATKSHNGLYNAIAISYSSKCFTTVSTEIKLNENICNAIALQVPNKPLCLFSQNELNFSISGDFPKDEVYTLYSVNTIGEKVALATSDKSPIKFKVQGKYYSMLMIESSKYKAQSNVINVDFLNENISYSLNYTPKVCEGPAPMKLDSIKFSYDKIQWFKDNSPIPNAHNYLYNATQSGIYSVKIQKQGCTILDSSSISLNVKIGEIEKPFMYPLSRAEIVSICQGFSTSLNAIVYGDTNVQYQWQLDGKDIPDAKQNTYIASKAGNYTLKVSQNNCEAISNSVRVIVGDLPIPTISAFPYNVVTKENILEICEGAEISINCNNCSSNGADGIEFQWQKDNADISLAINRSYYTKETGTYRLKISQGDCIVFSKPIIIKYGNPKILSLFSGTKEYCIGENVSSYVGWSSSVTSTQLYAKVYKDNQLFTESQSGKNIKLKESGNYNATLTFSIPNSTKTCTAYSDTVKIAFKDKLVNYNISSISSSSTCLDSLLIQGESWAGKRQWKLNGIALPDANDYFLMAKQSGAYQLETQTNSGCTYLSNPVNLAFNKLDAKITRFMPVCYDSSLVLRTSVNSILSYYDRNENRVYKPFSYEWKLDGKTIGNGDAQPVVKGGNYVFTFKHGTCSISDSVKIDLNTLKPIIPKTLNPNRDSLFTCHNGLVTIEAPKGDFTYSWLKNNRVFNGNQSQSIKTSSEGVYKVWIETKECARMSSAIVVKEKNIPPTAFISGSKEINTGDSTRIKIDLTSLPPWTIKLTNNQEFIANATPFEFAVKPLQTTVYELASVSNECGVGTVSGKAEIKIIILGNEELADAKIKLFPVPTQGICQLSVETVMLEKLGFQLYSVAGKMLMKSEESKPGHSFNEIINLESVPDGVYVLKIKIGDRVVNRKIIKGN